MCVKWAVRTEELHSEILPPSQSQWNYLLLQFGNLMSNHHIPLWTEGKIIWGKRAGQKIGPKNPLHKDEDADSKQKQRGNF